MATATIEPPSVEPPPASDAPATPDAAELDAELTPEAMDAAVTVTSPDDATPQLTLF